MKNIKVFWLPILVLILFCNCKKESGNIGPADGSIIKDIGGKLYQSKSIDDFESLSDTSNWNIYPGGVFMLDSINPFNGESSVHLLPITGCFELEKIEGIQVDMSKIYVVHFNYKMEPANYGFCPLFVINIWQGNELLLIASMSATNGWFENYEYFQPLNNIPVKIQISVGHFNGVWLDDLIVFEEL